MTAIAGLVHGGKVWIGGDSAATNAHWMQSIREDAKVFRVGEFLFGTSGSIRLKNILRYTFTAPTPLEGNACVAYLIRQFIPGLRAAYREAGALHADSGVEAMHGQMLIGWRGNLYGVESDFQVYKIANEMPFDAIGCGSELALGSLWTTQEMDLTPEVRLTWSLQAAERFSAGVRGPFVIESV